MSKSGNLKLDFDIAGCTIGASSSSYINNTWEKNTYGQYYVDDKTTPWYPSKIDPGYSNTPVDWTITTTSNLDMEGEKMGKAEAAVKAVVALRFAMNRHVDTPLYAIFHDLLNSILSSGWDGMELEHQNLLKLAFCEQIKDHAHLINILIHLDSFHSHDFAQTLFDEVGALKEARDSLCIHAYKGSEFDQWVEENFNDALRDAII